MKTRGEIQELIWVKIVTFKKKHFKVEELLKNTNIKPITCYDYLNRLVKGGYLKLIEIPAGTANVYELIKFSSYAPSLNKHGVDFPPHKRVFMWQAMRIVKVFSYKTLCLHASTEHIIVKEYDARSYIKALKKAGYLLEFGEVKTGVPVIYKLIKNTGTKPPQVKRDKSVYDPNLGQIVKAEAI